MVKPLDLQVKESIISRYEAGLTGIIISQELNIPIATIYGVLNRANIETRSTSNQNKKITDDAMDNILKLYNSGSSATKIAKFYGVSADVIQDRLHSAGCIMRNAKSLTSNKSYFNKLDTPRKCYWFGYLCADGSIPGGSHKRRRLSIHISKRDINLLHELRSELQSTNKIAERIEHSPFKENYETAYLQIGSKDLCNSLIKHGFLNIKNGDIKDLKNIRYINDFMRGYLDGDGSIWCSGNKRFISWCSQFKPILDYFGGVLVDNKLVSKFIVIHPSVYHLKIGGNIQCTSIMDWLCTNESFGLARKRY